MPAVPSNPKNEPKDEGSKSEAPVKPTVIARRRIDPMNSGSSGRCELTGRPMGTFTTERPICPPNPDTPQATPLVPESAPTQDAPKQ